MKFAGTLLVVRDISSARKLYEGLLGCKVAMDLGVYVAYTNGIALQAEETWLSFIEREADDIVYGANDAELYFDEHEIESFFIRMRGSACARRSAHRGQPRRKGLLLCGRGGKSNVPLASTRFAYGERDRRGRRVLGGIHP